MQHTPFGVVRCLAATAALAAATTVLAHAAAGAARTAVEASSGSDPGAASSPPFEAALLALATTALLVTSAWGLLIALAALVHAVSGTEAPLRRCCPAALRGTVLLLCGAALVGATGTAARADDDGPLGGLPSLDPPTGMAATPSPADHGAAGPRTPLASAGRVVPVRPGDSLWRIVTRRHPAAPAAEVARRVTALYRGNRAVIGSDPDRIFPGQLLRPTDHDTPK